MDVASTFVSAADAPGAPPHVHGHSMGVAAAAVAAGTAAAYPHTGAGKEEEPSAAAAGDGSSLLGSAGPAPSAAGGVLTGASCGAGFAAAVAPSAALPAAGGVADRVASTPGHWGRRHWQFLSTSWAIVADVDIESEVRSCGLPACLLACLCVCVCGLPFLLRGARRLRVLAYSLLVHRRLSQPAQDVTCTSCSSLARAILYAPQPSRPRPFRPPTPPPPPRPPTASPPPFPPPHLPLCPACPPPLQSLRCLGAARFDVYGALRAVCLRHYRGRFSFLPALPDERSGRHWQQPAFSPSQLPEEASGTPHQPTPSLEGAGSGAGAPSSGRSSSVRPLSAGAVRVAVGAAAPSAADATSPDAASAGSDVSPASSSPSSPSPATLGTMKPAIPVAGAAAAAVAPAPAPAAPAGAAAAAAVAGGQVSLTVRATPPPPICHLTPFDHPVPLSWRSIEGAFTMLYVTNSSHQSIGVCAAPGTRHDDGVLTVTLVRECGPLSMVSLLLGLDGQGSYVRDHHMSVPGGVVETYECLAFRLEPELDPRRSRRGECARAGKSGGAAAAGGLGKRGGLAWQRGLRPCSAHPSKVLETPELPPPPRTLHSLPCNHPPPLPPPLLSAPPPLLRRPREPGRRGHAVRAHPGGASPAPAARLRARGAVRGRETACHRPAGRRNSRQGVAHAAGRAFRFHRVGARQPAVGADGCGSLAAPHRSPLSHTLQLYVNSETSSAIPCSLGVGADRKSHWQLQLLTHLQTPASSLERVSDAPGFNFTLVVGSSIARARIHEYLNMPHA
jgi:hypothetical protein